MTEKEMAQQIKNLTKVIEKQAEYAELINRNFTSIIRDISRLNLRIMRLEGFKIE